MEKVTYRLDVFEGPLDLLISLIGKRKIEIWDINISQILEQYMDYLSQMADMDMEITSDFLAMASNLMYIKSKMLLPTEEDPEQEDPRLPLVQALKEYQRHKASAQTLQKMFFESGGSYIREPSMIDITERAYDIHSDPSELNEAFLRLFERNSRRLPPPIQSFNRIVGRETVPVSRQLKMLISKLFKSPVVKLMEILRGLKSRSEIVATFLALLELSKTRQVVTRENNQGTDITIKMLKNGDYSGDGQA